MSDYRRFDVREMDGVTILSLSDAKILDAAKINELNEDLLRVVNEDGKTHIAVEFEKVDFLSSAALNGLLNFDKALKANRGQLAFYGMIPKIREVFVITRLNQLFRLCNSQAEAIEYVSR